MELHKAMDSTTGKMEALTRVTSAMEPDMDMEFGKIRTKRTLAPTESTIRRDLEYTHGRIRKSTRGISGMITETVMGKPLFSID